MKSVRKLRRAFARRVNRLTLDPFSDRFQNGSALFFVTGRSKSGTTWMGRLLNSHPALFCDTSENCAFHQDFQFSYFANSPELVHQQARAFFDERTWALVKNGLLASLTHRCDKISVKMLGDKTPRQDIERILRVFPNSRTVVMIRDFRDVCVSLAFHQHRLSGTWRGCFADEELKALDNDFLAGHLRNYESHDDFATYSRLASRKPDRVMLVRYESLNTDQETALANVLSFLGVDHSQSVLKRCLSQNTFEKMSGGRKPGEGAVDSFYRKGVIGDWRNHFSEENISLSKEIMGETLIAAGYEQTDEWGVPC